MAPEESQRFGFLSQTSLLTVWHCAGFQLCGPSHCNTKKDMAELHGDIKRMRVTHSAHGSEVSHLKSFSTSGSDSIPSGCR